MRFRLSTKRLFAAGLVLLAVSGVLAGASRAYAQSEKRSPWVFLVVDSEPPYHMQDAGGKLEGFDVDLIEALSVKLKQPIELRLVSEEQYPKMVLSHEADAVVGVKDNRRYRNLFEYSNPVLFHKTLILIRKGTVVVNALNDLSGLKVGIRRNSQLGDMLKLIPGIKLLIEPDAESGLRDLREGKISVFLGDEHECRYYIHKNNWDDLIVVGPSVKQDVRYIAVLAGNHAMVEELNNALDELRRDFTFQHLYETWLNPTVIFERRERSYLLGLLIVLGLVATGLLLLFIWNQQLSEAVRIRTMEVQAEHEHFQNIFDHASDGILVLNPSDTSIVEANIACEIILGYSKEELLKLKLSELDIGKDRPITENFKLVMASQDSVLFEARLKNRASEMVDVLIHARTFPFKGRTMIEAIAQDITERKKTQKLKDDILQDVAHELKTPISKMGMSIELLGKALGESSDPSVGRYLDICQRAIERLRNTVEGILQLSRLESHAVKFHSEIFNLNGLARSVAEEMKMFAQRKGLSLELALTEEPVRVQGDEEMMRRVLVNLFSNAIKFTDKGTVKLSTQRDGGFVKVSVKDSGIGLEPEDLKKIFNRFYQKSAAYEGSGVGLTICEKIVNYHNGVIWAESDGIGKGTVMSVMMPVFD